MAGNKQENIRHIERDKRLLSQAFIWSERSKAVRLKVGAVIVHDENESFVTQAYNHTTIGYPEVCEIAITPDNDKIFPTTPEEAQQLKAQGHELKTNDYVIHAEAAALMELCRKGISTDGATLYVTDEPCAECAKLIVASGIKKVIYSRDYRLHTGSEILKRGGVNIQRITPDEISRCTYYKSFMEIM